MTNVEIYILLFLLLLTSIIGAFIKSGICKKTTSNYILL